MNTLFTDDFPYIESEAELQTLKDQYPEYDSYYIASGSIKERKEKFDALYERYYPYADSHFLTEAKIKFHQRTWEMYLGVCLLDKDISFSSEDIGPDFLIEKDGKRIWIECISPEKGDTDDRVPDTIYGIVQNVPSDEMLIRIAGALKIKFEKYKSYVEKGIVKVEDQFVIAVSRGELSHVDAALPLIFRAVFAVGHQTFTIPRDGQPPQYGWSSIPSIKKKNGSEVPMNFFINPEHDGISAVIYSKNTVLNHPDKLGDDLIILLNKIAKNPLSEEVFDSFKIYKCDENGDIHL
jgi:hypothetical protein